MSPSPNYFRVFAVFLRNALIRDMTFRSNFLVEIITRLFWFAAQLVLFELIYRSVSTINDWSRYEYFAFMATGMLINAIVETLFMPNCANFSELIRKGDLDFVLLKPIDTQFLISFEKVNLAMLNQVLLASCLLVYSLIQLEAHVSITQVCLYLLMIGVAVSFFYSMMLILSSTSIWFGRNQGLYDFWFYITAFARYPRSIYSGSVLGDLVQIFFSYVIPILLVVTVPARTLLGKTLEPSGLHFVAIGSALLGLFAARFVFNWSLRSYRSASS